MTKAISRYFKIVIILALAICSILSTTIIYNLNLNSKKEEMLYELKLIDYRLDYNKDLNKQINTIIDTVYNEDARITIMNEKGDILADTTDSTLSNHSDREEFKEAMDGGVGFSLRKSSTTKVNMLYVAYHHNQMIIRLSLEYNVLTDYLSSILPAILISVAISFIVATLYSRKLANTISKPILEIGEGIDNMSDDFRFDLKEYKYDEFNTIIDTIHNLSHRLRKSMREVEYEKTKMNEIIKQMGEGFILLDDQNNVLTTNSKAIEIVGNIKVHENILDYIYYPELIQAIQSKSPEQQLELKANNIIYNCYISRVDLGTTLFFVDITAIKKAELMRSEFFSNVSHELKTPMTSIKGYSELLLQGFVTSEEQRKVILDKINNEVNHMSRLISDILMLSRLENMNKEEELLPLKMKTIALEVLESHEVTASKHNITIHTDFDEVDYIGSHTSMHTLLSNLIGNAIKYNNDNGDVWITIERYQEAIKIVVKDNGIGIPKIDQQRIFERFYRVDKGRSRQLGGTGLGLAIVKHIVSLYQGTIHLESELDVGTTITVILPILKAN